LNVALAKKNKKHVPLVPLNFTRADIWRRDNRISRFKPSDLILEGEYPLADMESNAFVVSLFGGFVFFDSNDYKLIN
jgi:hypothetical protein